MGHPGASRGETTKRRLLEAAERLFADEGIDADSMRRISQEAGQRNNSALQYHFGGREALIEALVASRMAAINARRHALLELALTQKGGDPVADLVAVLLLPFVELLLDGERGSRYVRVVGQIFAQGRAVAVLGPERPWNDAFYAGLAALEDCLPGVPREVRRARIRLMADQVVHATARAEPALRGTSPRARRAAVRAFADQLVDYVAGALAAPHHAGASRLWATARPG